jgi:nucleoid-associated protein YgaU
LDSLDEVQRQEYDTLRQAARRTQDNVARLSGARGTYTVRSGDSLSRIALEFYGQNGNRWPEIAEANSHLEDPENLFVGMVLVIP